LLRLRYLITAGLIASFSAGYLLAAAAAGIAGFVLLRFWRPAQLATPAADKTCGCSTVARVIHPIDESSRVPIACTLTPGDFKERIAWIRVVAREALLSVCREPLALHLTYDAAAADRVREMVGKEQACCAFLRFDLREDVRGVHLSITAPPDAREAANELFAHFAPELARLTDPATGSHNQSREHHTDANGR
jgi:hypothetical protein